MSTLDDYSDCSSPASVRNCGQQYNTNTMTTYLAPLLSGTIFGAALTASSTYLPSVILDQLALRSTHMLTTFLTASACSTIIVYLSNRSGFASLMYRKNTSYGWFGRYDANLVGGALQGVGMALTGACPGTVLVQVALGIKPAPWILSGGLIGGMAFVVLAPQIRRSIVSPKANNKAVQRESHTFAQRFNFSETTTIAAYETALLGIIVAIDRRSLMGSHGDLLDPVFGGLLIGFAQVMSVVLSKKTLGVSSAYSDVAEIITSWVSGTKIQAGLANVVFAIGVMSGARLISQRLSLATAGPSDIGIASAIFGGALSIFGARLAGGCTSGHGISGLSTLSLSSFATISSMFLGGTFCKQIMMVMGW